MHTVMMFGGGVLLLAVCLLLGYWRNAANLGGLWFIPIWFFVVAVNMWIGVTQAGYTFTQEIPFFLLLFLPLTALALVARYLLK